MNPGDKTIILLLAAVALAAIALGFVDLSIAEDVDWGYIGLGVAIALIALIIFKPGLVTRASSQFRGLLKGQGG